MGNAWRTAQLPAHETFLSGVPALWSAMVLAFRALLTKSVKIYSNGDRKVEMVLIPRKH